MALELQHYWVTRHSLWYPLSQAENEIIQAGGEKAQQLIQAIEVWSQRRVDLWCDGQIGSL